MSATLIHFTCPRCHRGLKVAAEAGGGHRPCPACGHMLEVPAIRHDWPSDGADEAGAAHEKVRHPPPPPAPPRASRFGAAGQPKSDPVPARRVTGLPFLLALGLALVAVGAVIAYLLGRPVSRPTPGPNAPLAATSDRPDSASPRPAPTTPRDRPAPDRPAPAPESDEVLVPGEPALTREMAAQAIAFYEWALDIRMSQELRRTFRDDLVSEWKRADRAGRDKTAGTIQAMEKVRREDGPSERAQRRALVLQSLRKETDAVPRKLVELYEAKHGKPTVSDSGATKVAGVTAEQINTLPTRFAEKEVVLAGVLISGHLFKYRQSSRNPERFLLTVTTPGGKRFGINGHLIGDLMFEISPDLAGKLLDEGVVSNRAYRVTLTGKVVKMAYWNHLGWAVSVTRIDMLDRDGKVLKTLTGPPPSRS